MEALIERWGLVAVFLGTLLEGDVVMLLAGVVAHLGFLKFAAAFLAGAAGAIVSDVAWFAAGRWQAGRIRESALYRRAGPGIERVAGRIGPRQVMLCRFVYGTRVPTLLLWAVRGLSFPRFLALDLAGCILWAAAFGCLEYFMSGSAALVMGEVKRVEYWLLGGLLVAIAVVLGLKALAGWQKRRAES
jgi:membrane protein DedA with SNARE-associated domain